MIWAASPVWAFHWLAVPINVEATSSGLNLGWTHWMTCPVSDSTGMPRGSSGLSSSSLPLWNMLLVGSPVAAPSLGGCTDLYNAPEKVIDLGDRCVDLCEEVIDAIYDVGPQYMGGYPGTIRFFWAPGRIIEMAEDLSIMMPPTSHRRFVAPIHQELGRRFLSPEVVATMQ